MAKFVEPEELPRPSVTMPETPQDNVPLPREQFEFVDPDDVEPDEAAIERFLIGLGYGTKHKAQGWKQLGLSVAEAANPTTNSADLAAYTQKVKEEQEFWEASPMAQTPEAQAGELIGQMALDAAVPIGGKAVSATRRMGGAMLGGAAIGASEFVESPAERATNTALGAAFGGGGSALLDTARFNANIVRSKFRRAFKQPDIVRTFNKSSRISRETGIDFTSGQATGSRTLLSLENAAIESERAADKVLALRNKQLRQGLQAINKTIKDLGDPTVSPGVVGRQLKEGVDSTVDRIVKIRSHLWDKNMKEAVTASKGRPLGQPVHAATVLDDIIEEVKNPLSTFPKSVSIQLERLRNALGKSWTVEDYRDALKLWGRNSAGTGRPFKDLDTADSRRIFKRLVGAVNDDLDLIVNKSKQSATTIRALKRARESWKINSQKIDELENTVVGQLINKSGRPAAPEEIYRRVAKMEASQLKHIVPILNRADPAIMNNVRAQIVKDALDRSMIGASAPESLVRLNPGQFINNLPLTESMGEIFKGAPRKSIVKTMQAIRRIADRSNVSGSGQSPLGTMTELGGLAGGGIQAGGLPDPVFIGRFLAKNITPERYAKLLMTKEGQKAVANIAGWQKVSRKTLAASIGVLTSVLTEDMDAVEQTEDGTEQE